MPEEPTLAEFKASLRTDVEYAMVQLELGLTSLRPYTIYDCINRAKDSLERIQEKIGEDKP